PSPAYPGLPVASSRGGHPDDGALEQGRGHRRRLRSAQGSRDGMSGGPTVAFATLGCRLNQVESQEMRALVEQAGYRAVDFSEPAQVYVVNTCTVTSRADFSDRQAIRRITRANPDALVVVTGCLAQTNPDALARMPGVDLVLGNREKYRLPELIGSLVKRGRSEEHTSEL